MFVWVNMLFLFLFGFIKIFVGVCVIVVEFVDIGYEIIMEGKVCICFVGGFDDFGEEGLYEFVNMKVMSNIVDEFVYGCILKEMLWFMIIICNGFMEFQGCGIQIIMIVQFVIDMGMFVYGIVVMIIIVFDKIGCFVFVFGQGVFISVCEYQGKFFLFFFDINYCCCQIECCKKQIKQWQEFELEFVYDEVDVMKVQGVIFDVKEYVQDCIVYIEKEVKCQECEFLCSMGNNFWK